MQLITDLLPLTVFPYTAGPSRMDGGHLKGDIDLFGCNIRPDRCILMTVPTRRFIEPVIFLLILCILAAGCTSKTEIKPAPATTVPITTASKVLTPVPTPHVTVSDNGSKTCIQLKGTIVIPAQVCTGIWLMASDSFSCCSKILVAGKITKPRLVVDPLALRITYNDTFVALGI